LQEIGSLTAQKPHTSRRNNLASYLFFMVISGSGTLEYDGISYDLTVGDCVFIDCKKPYFHRSSEDLWTLKWVHFYGPNMAGIYEKYTERGENNYTCYCCVGNSDSSFIYDRSFCKENFKLVAIFGLQNPFLCGDLRHSLQCF